MKITRYMTEVGCKDLMAGKGYFDGWFGLSRTENATTAVTIEISDDPPATEPGFDVGDWVVDNRGTPWSDGDYRKKVDMIRGVCGAVVAQLGHYTAGIEYLTPAPPEPTADELRDDWEWRGEFRPSQAGDTWLSPNRHITEWEVVWSEETARDLGPRYIVHRRKREPESEHINADGKFQSDKYPTCPAGKVPLSTGDPMAQDLLREYARRRESVDKKFSEDLLVCLERDGYEPDLQRPEVMKAVYDSLYWTGGKSKVADVPVTWVRHRPFYVAPDASGWRLVGWGMQGCGAIFHDSVAWRKAAKYGRFAPVSGPVPTIAQVRDGEWIPVFAERAIFMRDPGQGGEGGE